MITQDLETTLVDYKYSLPFYALSTALLFYLYTHSSISYFLSFVAIVFAIHSLRVKPYSNEEYRLFDFFTLYNFLVAILSVIAKNVTMLLFSLFQIAFIFSVHADSLRKNVLDKVYNFIVKHIAHLNDILALSHFFLYLYYAVSHANLLSLILAILTMPVSLLLTLILFYKNNGLVRNTAGLLFLAYTLLMPASYLIYGLLGVVFSELFFVILLVVITMWLNKKIYKVEKKEAKDLTMDDIKYSVVLNEEGNDVFLYYDSLDELKEKEKEVTLVRKLVLPMFPALLVSFILFSLSLLLSNI